MESINMCKILAKFRDTDTHAQKLTDLLAQYYAPYWDGVINGHNSQADIQYQSKGVVTS